MDIKKKICIQGCRNYFLPSYFCVYTYTHDCSHHQQLLCSLALQPWNEETLAPWEESYDKPRQCIERQRHHFADKNPYSQSCGFSSSQLWMWELFHKNGEALKNWCLRTVVLEKTLKSPLDYKVIKPVNPKGNQAWTVIRGTCVCCSWSYNTLATWCEEYPAAGKD